MKLTDNSSLAVEPAMNEEQQHLYYAWIVLSAVAFVVFCTSGLRGSFGVFIKPLEAEFGWTRAARSPRGADIFRRSGNMCFGRLQKDSGAYMELRYSF